MKLVAKKEPAEIPLSIAVTESIHKRYRIASEKLKPTNKSVGEYAREFLEKMLDQIDRDLDGWPDDAA